MRFRDLDFWDAAENDGAAPIFQLTDNATRIDRHILVMYPDIARASRVLVGFPFLAYAPGGQAYISRITPHPFEGFTNQNGDHYIWAESIPRADGVAVMFHNQITNTPLGLRSRMSVLYTTRPYKILEDSDPAMQFQPASGQSNPLAGFADEATLQRFVSVEVKPFQRVITVPRSLLRWVLESGDTDILSNGLGPYVEEGIGKPESGLLLELTHWRRPEWPLNTILQAMGRINTYTMRVPQGDRILTFAPGTLLCEAPEIRTVNSLRGELNYDIVFRFRMIIKSDQAGNLRDMNHYLRLIPRISGTPNPTLDYRLLTTTGLSSADGDRTFRTFDHSKLFRPDAS